MNHIYRLVWNAQTQRSVPAPESARGRGKVGGRAPAPLTAAALLLGAVFSLPVFAQAGGTLAAGALPSGGQVVAGQAGIAQSGNQMTVTQGSDKAIINWQRFDIGANAAVQFIQPSTSAVALNRVIAGDASQIHGKLSANGQVWLINPNGVVFGKGSRVDVGGLVASTLSITDSDFLAGKAVFSRNGATGSIVNQGEINAADGGLVALLAPTVRNEGIVTARLGSVAMAAGDRIALDAGANGLLQVAVEPATVKTLIENRQLIVADGGQVVMTGRAADALSASVVANTGTIQANALQERDGRILLIADMKYGETQAAGTLQAKFVDTSAATVSIDKNLRVNTAGGEWLIDPVDITIDSAKATAIQTALGSGNVTVSTASGAGNAWGANGTGSDKGDIHVNADIAYAQNTLTLNADNHINVNAQINVNGTGTLTLNYGGTAGNAGATPLAGSKLNVGGKVNFANAGAGLLSVNGHGYTVIKDMTALQAINGGLGGKYALGADIDAASFGNFTPIGDGGSFSGTFDGLGHVIRNLVIDQPGMTCVGLFGFAESGSVIRNVGLEGGSVKGGAYAGGLVGYNVGSISNSYATGSVSVSASGVGWAIVGGLVGFNGNGGSISASYATGSVGASASGSGGSRVGGLVGFNDSGGSISTSYATGSVTASDEGGGLVGFNLGSISTSYATGSVSVSGFFGPRAGGLVGINGNGGSISTSYATGSVSTSGFGGDSRVGGLVGINDSGGSISTSYATGSVTASNDGGSQAGGLVGFNLGSISISYATGSVSASVSGGESAFAGGLVGFNGNGGSIGASYAMGNVSVSGLFGSRVGGLVGFNDSGGSISTSYATGSVTASDGVGSQAGGLVGFNDSGGSITGAFYATTDANGNVINNGGATGGNWSGNAFGTGKSLADLQKAGTFAAWGADIDDRGGSGAVWRIYEGHSTPLLRSFLTALTVDAGTLADKVYDGSASGTVGSYTPSVSGAQPAGSLSYTAASKNAGTYRTSDGSLRLGGLYSDQRGYDISYAGSSLTVDKAALTVTTGAVTKTYDGTTAAAGSAIAGAGTQLFGSDTFSGGSFAFTDKNAGAGKTVTVSNVTVNDGNGGNNYTVTYADNTASTIDKAALTVTTGAVTKTYDGTTAAAGSAIAGAGTQLGVGDTLSGGSFAFTDKNAGSGKTVTVSGVTINDGNGGNNYTVTYADNAASTIAKAALTVTAADASKTEGSVLAFTGSEFATGGGQLKNGETLVRVDLSSSGAPADAKAGRYAIEAENAQGGNGFDASNYDIAYVNGILSVAAKAGASENQAPSGGTIWRNQAHEANRASPPARPGQAGGGAQALAAATPFLTLAPVFIRARGEE